MTRSPRTIGWGLRLALLTALISGVAVWLNAFAVKQVADPAVYTTLKNLVAAVVLLGIVAARGGIAEARALDRRRWGVLVLVGLVGGGIPFLLFFTGLAQATAPGAAFIQKTLFVWVALLAVPFLGERLGMAQIGAIAVLLVGQLLLVPPRLDGASWGSGETMIAAATALWAIEVVIVKRLLGSVSAPVVGAARLGFGVLFLFGYLVLNGSLGAIGALTATGAMWVLVTGLVLAAYVATWFAALRHAPASAVTAVLVVGAVLTAGLQALSNGTLPGIWVMAGALGLVGAVVVVAASSIRAARVSAPEARSA